MLIITNLRCKITKFCVLMQIFYVDLYFFIRKLTIYSKICLFFIKMSSISSHIYDQGGHRACIDQNWIVPQILCAIEDCMSIHNLTLHY